MLTIDKLNELGANTAEGLQRCLNDEGFYLGLVPSALEKARYEELDQRIKAKDLDGAFETAHALKGILANLSLTPIFDVVNEITELLRSKTDTDYSGLVDKMWEQWNKFAALL